MASMTCGAGPHQEACVKRSLGWGTGFTELLNHSVDCYVNCRVKSIEGHDSQEGIIKPGESSGICYFFLNDGNIMK